MQTLARRVTPHVRCPDEGVRAGCRPVPGAWGRTATGREAGTPLGLRPRLHTPVLRANRGLAPPGGGQHAVGTHFYSVTVCDSAPHRCRRNGVPARRGQHAAGPPGSAALLAAGSPSDRGSRLQIWARAPRPPPACTPTTLGTRVPVLWPPLLPAHSLPRLHPPQLQRGVQEGRGHTWVTPGATLSTSRGQKPNHRPVGGPPVFPARLRPQHTALLASGPQVPRRVSVGCPTRAELSPSRPAFAGSETPLGLQQTEAPPRGAAGALADLQHGLRPLATRAEGPDPLTTLNGWAAGSWCRVERDCWCGWPRAGGCRGGGGASPPPCTH